MTTVQLWRRPRIDAEPAGFAIRVRELHHSLADIGRRFTHAALASSLSIEDMVVAHAIVTTDAAIDVFMIDTGRLHAQTLSLRDALKQRFGVDVLVVRPDPKAEARYVTDHGLNAFYDSTALRHACCHFRKVEPLERALAGRDAWLTGQRRAHGPDRARLAERELDAARGIPKFNPLAAWSDEDVWFYADKFDLPVNPLYARGYPSIGCEPCTRPIRVGEDARAGRWWWESATHKECGLHAAPETSPVTAAAHATSRARLVAGLWGENQGERV